MGISINDESSRIVCVLGMHRSGTSLVARILNLLGIYLGPEEHLMRPMEDNPKGYWEHGELTAINDQILLHLGGGWDTPPKLPPEWYKSADLDYLRQRARDVISRDFSDSGSWGWKDPRNSLTLPFWQELVRPTHYVICLRNPRDVVQSLQQRNSFSADKAEHLWITYVANAIVGTTDRKRFFIFFEDILRDWREAVQRLATFIDIPAMQQFYGAEESIRQFIEPGLAHHSASSLEAMSASTLQGSSKSLHLILRELSILNAVGPNDSDGAENGDTPSRRLAVFAQSTMDAQTDYGQRLDELDQLKARFAQQEKRIEQLLTQIEESELDLDTLRSDSIAMRAQLESMSSGLAFGLLTGYRSWVERLLPLGSRRRAAYFLALKALRICAFEGPKGIWERIRAGRWKVLLVADRVPARSKQSQPIESIGALPSERTPVQNKYAVAYGALVASSSSGLGHDNYVPLADDDFPADQAPAKLIAFYLPQFHPIPENDNWWGKGFTDWTNVSRAVPQFVGHYQPHLPDELGFYDLRIPEIQQRQVELARKYGIYGFCFYYYWFNGKRLLERPLEQFISNPNIDFPFCLCWANENWTRRWDGREDEILIAQEHSPQSDFAFIRDVASLMRKKTYIRIKGRPVLIVYRPSQISSPVVTVKRWRQYCQEIGVGDPYLVAVQTFGFTDPRRVGFDAAVEFPPHNVHIPTITHSINILNPDYQGNVFRYDSIVDLLSRTPNCPYKLYKTVFPGWDNEPRRQARGSTFAFSTPRAYEEWLVNCTRQAMQDPDIETHLVFINAWNEWAEGAHLEPDRKYGYAYLQATADALRQTMSHNSDPNRGETKGQSATDPRTRSVSKDPIIIYQMGKVGSKTMEHSLRAAYESLSLRVPIYHIHMLNGLDNIEQRVRRERRNPAGTMRALQRGRDMRKLLDKSPMQHWKIITLVREPVGRNVATLFQNIDEFIPDWRAQYVKRSDGLLDDLQELLLEAETISRAPEWWFESQLEPVFGIDVFAHPFPKDIGYRIYENTPLSSLLLIRLENLDGCASAAVGEFLGIEKFALVNTNIGISKDYGAVYRAFLDRPLQPDYLRKVYGTKFAGHFYTQDEIAKFTRRWMGRQPIVADTASANSEVSIGRTASAMELLP